MASADPVVRNAHRNLGPTVAFLLLALATAAGLYFGVTAKQESGEVAEKVEAAGPPCVDANGELPGIVPSEGCRPVFELLANLCAQNPAFCRESQRRAVKAAQQTAADREIGPLARLPEGGGGSEGNNPRSPTGPPSGGPDPDEPDEVTPMPEPGPDPQPQPEPEPPPSTDPDPPPVDTENPQLPGLVEQIVDGVEDVVKELVPPLLP
jgi:hypothetical protein